MLVITGYNPGAGGFTGTGSLNGRTSIQAPRAFGTFDMNTVSYSFGATFPVNAGTEPWTDAQYLNLEQALEVSDTAHYH